VRIFGVGIMASRANRNNRNAENNFAKRLSKSESEEFYADEKKRQAAQPLYLKRYE
jgi:hypothetical protein